MHLDLYLEKLLSKYAGSFDLYQPYVIGETTYPAYGYFFSHTEKYVLVREANMWTSESFEHVLFITADRITTEHVAQADDLIRNYMEPELVRKGERYPAENHMYSYLSVVLISQKPIDEKTKKAVKRYSFDKGYKWNMRGYSQGRLACVSIDDKQSVTNRSMKQMRKLFLETLEQ